MDLNQCHAGRRVSPEQACITASLSSRPTRPVDYACEALAQSRLARRLSGAPDALVQDLAEEAMHVTRAASGGFSVLLTHAGGSSSFRWLAAAGHCANLVGLTELHGASASCMTVELQSPQLFAHPHRAFAEFDAADPPIAEWLSAPVNSPEGMPLGVVWCATHGGGPRFDAEDARRLASLAAFAGAALETMRRRDDALSQVRASRCAYEAAVLSESRKDDFLAALAHEIRTPVSAISNAASVLGGRSLDACAQQMAEVVGRQALRIGAVVDDLMDLAKIGRGAIELRLGPAHVPALLDAAMEALQPQLQAKHQSLRRGVDEPSQEIRCDSMRIQQVLINLIGNAVKYTDAGGTIKVMICTEGSNVRIAIQDSGRGIAAADLDRIFKLYGQAERTSEEGAAGLGIGLALAHRLVSLHQGELTVHSDGAGHGSTFTLVLPIAGPRSDHGSSQSNSFAAS